MSGEHPSLIAIMKIFISIQKNNGMMLNAVIFGISSTN